MFYYGRSIAALHTYTSARVRQRTQYYYKYSGRVPASHRDFRCSLKQLKMTLKGFSIGLYVAITLLAACHSAEAARSASPARQRGTITITNTNRGTDPAMASLAGLGTPMAIDSSQAAIGTAVKTNIKRIYFKNNCTCTDGAQDTDAPYPQVALSYKPVQSADFYNIGYWKVTGCDAKYLVATTEGRLVLNSQHM